MVDVADVMDEKIEREGWTKRSILDEPRLTEVAEMYRSIGFEVKLVPLETNSIEGCTSCFESSPKRFSIVYTRDGSGQHEDIFS